MTIFLDNAGMSGTAFFNLETISGESGAVGMEDVPGDLTVFQISYADIAGQPATADRLSAIVNNNFGAPITTSQIVVITALNGGIDPYLGLDVTGNGFSYFDDTVTPPVIRNVYDVSQCCGAGLALIDINGNDITTPNPVILYHELSHAFREATGTKASNDEIPATTDENVLRAQLGLCLRDVNNHDGSCAGGSDCGGSSGNADGGPPAGGCAAGNDDGCFIVSATTGSSESDEVKRLRRLRDRVAGLSGLGGRLIDEIYREYFLFSPAVAAELDRDGFARQAVLWTIVRPLLAWYTLAGALALDERRDRSAIERAARDVLRACPSYLGRSSVAGLLETIRSGEPLPAGAPQLLLDFAPRIQMAARFRFASWAILDPLVRAWRSAADRRDLVDEVSQWLASAPLEALTPPSDPERLDQELRSIAGFFDFRPMARQQIGERLAEAWPDAADALERHGFIQQRGA